MAGGSAGRLAPPLLLLLVLCAIRQLSLHAELLHEGAELPLAVVEVALRILRAPARRRVVDGHPAARLVFLEARKAATPQLLVHETALFARELQVQHLLAGDMPRMRESSGAYIRDTSTISFRLNRCRNCDSISR